MTCHEVGRLLDAYVDHELEPGDSTAVEEHLASCPACHRRVTEREALGRLIRTIPYHSMPDDVRGALAATQARRHWRLQLLAVAAAAAPGQINRLMVCWRR